MACRPTTITTKYAGQMFTSTDLTPITDKIVEFAQIINEQNNPAEGYDRAELIRLTGTINRLLRRTDLTDYPLLDNRLNESYNIPYMEFADFLNQSGYSFDDMSAILDSADTVSQKFPVFNSGNTAFNNQSTIIPFPQFPSSYVGVIDQLEFYNTENIANTVSGGFCSGFGSSFGSVLDKIEKIALGAALLIKLSTFSLADLFDLALRAALDAIKEKLLEIVELIKATILQQIQNIVGQICQIAGENIAIWDDFTKRSNDAKGFFSDISIQKIKDEIKKFIDESIAQFEELTPEAIALLLFRFCQFAEMIQGFMRAPGDAVRNYANRIKLQMKTVTSMGLENTKLAVKAGATRFSEEARRDAKRRMMDTLWEKVNDSPNASQPPAVPKPEAYITNPFIECIESTQLSRLSEEGIPGKIKWSESVLNMGKSVEDAEDDAGWKSISNEVKLKLLRVANRINKELVINSGYRSPEYNRRIGGAKRSMHMSGLAVDVSMEGFSSDDVKRFIRAASQEGFSGMAYYAGSNFIHVDIGTRRTWGNNSGYASWINAHVRDEYRSGAKGLSEAQQIA